jgi:hypothetical protein
LLVFLRHPIRAIMGRVLVAIRRDDRGRFSS